jgi:hypothetical protein
LSVFLFFILTFLYMGQASAETIVCDTTSSSTIPGGLVPYSLNFNCEVPVDATASLEIKWTDSSYNDNRDFLMCGGSELYATGNAGPMMPPYPRTVTSDVTSCLQGYNLATGNRICTANAWNLDCGGFNYGTTEYYASFEYAKLTITSPDKILTNIGNITGTTEVGQTLTAGSLTPSGATVDYQWMRSVTVDGEYADIENATSTSYVLTSDDIGNYIKVKATSNAEYTGIVVSEPTSLVEAVSDPFANYSEEGIDGLSTSTAYTIATCEQLQNINILSLIRLVQPLWIVQRRLGGILTNQRE